MKDTDFIASVKKQFEYYKLLGEKTFEQVEDEKLFYRPNSESNSLAIIVQHLWGNMMSRWTDFLNSDGEKEWRRRDEEFEPRVNDRVTLLRFWNEGWNCLFRALDAIGENDLDRVIYIRNQGHSVMEAINRQLAHYSYHVGQIVYIGKMLSAENWQSLSIPKNRSAQYNAEKFAQEKERKHFTEDYLKKKTD